MKARQIISERSFVLVFETGDEAVKGLLEFARENEVKTAFFFGIGAFGRVTLAYFDLEKKNYEHIPIDEQVEVMSLAGNISRLEGDPKVHAHVVVGNRDGAAHGGHLIEGVVRPTLEIFMSVSETPLRRKLDAATNLPLLDLNE